MPDYQVVVEYVTKGTLAAQLPAMAGGATALGGALARSRGEAHSLMGALGEVGSVFKNAGSAIADSFTGAVESVAEFGKGLALVAGGAAIAGITYGVVHLNAELEQTNISLAAVFNAQGMTTDFNSAMGLATDQVAKMKTEVKQLPGTFLDLSSIMQSVAIPGAQAGLTADKLRNLAEQTQMFGMGIRGLGASEAGGGMAQLLAGNARSMSPMAQALGFTGAAGKKLRAESAGDRYKDIEKALAKYDAAREAFSHTWKAVSTTVKDDILLSLLAPATSPLFESVKKTLVDIHGWFDKNQTQIGRFTDVLGKQLAHAWERGSAIFKEWLPAITTFATDAYIAISNIWTKVEPVVSRIAQAIKESIGDGTALTKIESILKLYAAVKFAGAVMPMAGGAATIGKAIGGIIGSAGAAEAEAGAGTVAGGAAAAGLGAATFVAGALAVAVIGTVAVAVAGETSALLDTSSPEHVKAVAARDKLAAGTDQLGTAMHGANEALEGAFGVQFDGHGMQRWGEFSTLMTATAVSEFGKFIGLFSAGAVKPPPGLEIPNSGPRTGESASDFYERTRYKTDSYIPPSAARGKEDSLPFGAKKIPPTPAGVTNINNYFTISSNHDPSRIARDVVSHIAESRRFPKQSPDVHQPSGLRGS